MKKFSWWFTIVIVLLAMAGTGYAQTPANSPARIVPPPVPPGVFSEKIVGLTLPVNVSFGNGPESYGLVPTRPCRLVDTTDSLFVHGERASEPLIYGGGPFQNGETREYPLSGTCLDVPREAQGIVMRVATIGLTDNSLGCGGRIDTTTASTPSATGGMPSGCGVMPFATFQPGTVSSTTGVALVKPVNGLGGYMYSSIGLRASGGTTHVIVDIIGYIK